MITPDDLFLALAQSPFRRRFRLGAKERAYLAEKGLDAVLDHGRAFIAERLAPAHPPNDGKQTPMRGHPVFVAQHATATCCRGCLATWHGIPAGCALTESEIEHVLAVIRTWMTRSSMEPAAERPRQPQKRAAAERQLRLF